MSSARNDPEDGAELLARAAMRACVFDFAAAQDLCGRVLALEPHRPRAKALLKAIEHNRSSHLYELTARRQAEPAAPGPVASLRNLLLRGRARSATTAGHFEVSFEDRFMTVAGSVTDSSPTVYAFVNELLFAAVPTTPDTRGFRRSRRFSFKISTSSLSLFPGSEPARLAISTGRHMLRHTSQGAFYRCDWPAGKGGIEDAILNGAMLTIHHRIKPGPAPATIERWLDAYDRLSAFMQETAGKPLFLYYGSLLGAVRDGRVIPFDDDFDVAYFSDRTSPHEIKEEMISIIAALAASDARLLIRLTNFFFKVRIEGNTIDVFPAWHDGKILWSPWSTRLESDENLLKELVEKEFHGRPVLVPARAEEFLELKYGNGWRTPDPTYRTKALPRDAYPFRQIPFGEDDRARIVKKAREIAGGEAVATVKLFNE